MAGNDAALWFVFRGGRMLVFRTEPTDAPRAIAPEDLGLDVRFRQEIGALDGRRCYAAELKPDAEVPEEMMFRDLQGLLVEVDERFFAMAGRARQIVEWHETHRFCGRCGAETASVTTELAKECPRCGMLFYPRLSPAVIVLVKRGDSILMARSPGFPPGIYSVLAGFVEPGESIEAAISREVCEEVGVEVENVRYFGSQPWPFPHSLMIGFTADYAGGELRVEPAEIEDAGWFEANSLPAVPPKASIARAMIDQFVAHHGRSPETLETSA
ncbi:MAG: NAD(+) diphosphatase [Rubrobacter sp.]|nr:NAD(+) diphosphatase [Rubrobacter sp.]